MTGPSFNYFRMEHFSFNPQPTYVEFYVNARTNESIFFFFWVVADHLSQVVPFHFYIAALLISLRALLHFYKIKLWWYVEGPYSMYFTV